MPIDEMGNTSMCEPHVKTFARDLKLKDIRDPSSELDANSGSKSAIPTPGFNFHKLSKAGRGMKSPCGRT